MAKKQPKSAATVVIRDASDMTERGRREVALWLRRQARFLEKHADSLSRRYRARYLYR
ncbi:hypothetical protein [Bradyrhizobium sp. Leo121]|uniref:hypothetical protein n=1 Tax=Bradyrhizobium sp. Leo121 TaxID=1571195 RepID=UPI0013EF5516|nr:hypothetical protein [Bradyrhizobium sp. Leo121]